MKFDRPTAEELLNALVQFSRNGIAQYNRLSNMAGRSDNWNDRKSREYQTSVQQINVSVKHAFEAISAYKEHFEKKIEELN